VLCAVCTVHVEMRSAGFLVEPQNQDRRFVVWSQNHSDGFSSVWASKPMATVYEWFGLKTTRTVFIGLASKPVVTVSGGFASKPVVGFLVEPQNQDGEGFPGLGLKTSNSSLVIWVSKSQRRFLGLGLKTKRVSVCRLRHKTDGGRSARDTR
jgi:hypothetical protein